MEKAGDIAREALSQMMPTARRAEVRACMAWPDAVGSEIAAQTRPMHMRQGAMTVAASNAAWATELGYLAEELKEQLNAALGTEAVKSLRFVVRPQAAGPEERE